MLDGVNLVEIRSTVSATDHFTQSQFLRVNLEVREQKLFGENLIAFSLGIPFLFNLKILSYTVQFNEQLLFVCSPHPPQTLSCLSSTFSLSLT